jgi:hypothetical protein
MNTHTSPLCIRELKSVGAVGQRGNVQAWIQIQERGGDVESSGAGRSTLHAALRE